MDFEERIEAYLKEPREWQTHCRFQHAQYQAKIAKTDEDRKFWQAIGEIEGERLQHLLWVMTKEDVWADRDKIRLLNNILKRSKKENKP